MAYLYSPLESFRFFSASPGVDRVWLDQRYQYAHQLIMPVVIGLKSVRTNSQGADGVERRPQRDLAWHRTIFSTYC